jgi:gamma-glutamylcyclotransferase (GGCT)/AIG2-like uncharacterized protein YtfP
MNVFVYGTLLVPKIWNAVTHCPDLVSHPAVLSGYANFRVRNADYPGIVEVADRNAVVSGRVFLEVSDDALRRLDAYEDTFYDRRTIIVRVPDGSELEADAYCVPVEKAAAILSDEVWTLAWFEANALDRFWSRAFGT